jgi:uncharacterized membrane protein YidH (DUF202 family)
MDKNFIKHHRFFINAIRTALIFIAGFLSYEILKYLEESWNKTHPNQQVHHFTRRKLYHFIIIFIIDLLILYTIFYLFNEYL